MWPVPHAGRPLGALREGTGPSREGTGFCKHPESSFDLRTLMTICFTRLSEFSEFSAQFSNESFFSSFIRSRTGRNCHLAEATLPGWVSLSAHGEAQDRVHARLTRPLACPFQLRSRLAVVAA